MHRVFVDQRFENHYYDVVNECLKEWVGNREGLELRLYQSVEHAINEITQGLAQMFSHRNEVLCFRGMSPYYRRPMLLLARRGLMVHEGGFADFSEPSYLETHLNRSSLLVAYNLDDPLTGRLFSPNALRKAMEGKNVYCLTISHSHHLFNKPSFLVGSHEVQIFSFPDQGALALLGSRTRGVAETGPFLRWTPWEKKVFGEIVPLTENDRTAILAFEASCPGGGVPLLSNQEARLWDRALISWEDIDGEALIHTLTQVLEVHKGPGPWSHLMETASLCRWQTLGGSHWLQLQGFTPKQIRGLLVLDRELIYMPEFSDLVYEAVEQLRHRQQVIL
jgi:hypothetical protein